MGKDRKLPPWRDWRKNLPESYKEDERLDGRDDIAQYLGISKSKLDKTVLHRMKEAGIIFKRAHQRGGRKVRTQYFTYKRLVHAWLIKVKEI